jgi:hypothetical protein
MPGKPTSAAKTVALKLASVISSAIESRAEYRPVI